MALCVTLTSTGGWDARAAATRTAPGRSVAGSHLDAPGRATPGSLAGRWSWPVAPLHHVVRGYDQPTSVWSPGHRGIDIAAVPAGEVPAPDDGVVHFAGPVVDRPVLSIGHAGGELSRF